MRRVRPVNRLDIDRLRVQLAGGVRDILKRLSVRTPGIVAAQVCTIDGFEIAGMDANVESQRRLAAMVSAIHALGAAIVTESRLGECTNLILEATEGKTLMMSIPGSSGRLLLAAIGAKDLLFGHFHAACKSCCEEIRVLNVIGSP